LLSSVVVVVIVEPEAFATVVVVRDSPAVVAAAKDKDSATGREVHAPDAPVALDILFIPSFGELAGLFNDS